jgi:hypothetical protein
MDRHRSTDDIMLGRRRVTGGWFGIVVAVLFLAGWFAVAIWRTTADWNIVAHGILTTGTVTTAGFCGGGDSEIGAVVEYTDRAGMARRGFAQTCNGEYPKGSVIAFRYLPSEPSRILTDDDVSHLREWTIALIAMPVTIVAFAMLFIWLWRRSRRVAHDQPWAG